MRPAGLCTWRAAHRRNEADAYAEMPCVAAKRSAHGVCAPAASQRPTNLRSSSVIRVALPGGMERVAMLVAWIFAAFILISAGELSRTPPGAAARPGAIGVAAWQPMQRNSRMPRAILNDTGASPATSCAGATTDEGVVNSASTTAAIASGAGLRHQTRQINAQQETE